MGWRHGEITKVKIDDFEGVAYSHKMAADDLDAVNEYRSIIVSVGRDKRVDPAVIAGIISRESSGGETIKPNNKHNNPVGWGDHENGWGLMQVDKLGGNREVEGAWDSVAHLKQATDILLESIEGIREKFDEWDEEQQLRGGLAAYNMGVGCVKIKYKSCFGWLGSDEIDWDASYDSVDSNTTGKDYSGDVVARAQWYKKKWDKEY